MTQPLEVRASWEEFWRKVDRGHKGAKDTQGALSALFDRYRHLQLDERRVIDQFLGEKLASSDENVRFDVLALVREFNIRSTAPQLRELATRLGADKAPGAPFELAKVTRILTQFDQAP
jgi:hypothetical protein